MTDIFFTHRVSGTTKDDSMRKWYNCIRNILLQQNIDGTLLEKKKKQVEGRAGKTPDEIYCSLMDCLRSANFLIADVTYPSHGVGYEISYAQSNQYKVLCLFHKTPGRDIDQLSPMIRGATGANFAVEAYENEEDLARILTSYFA